MTWTLADSVAYECAHEALSHALGLRMADLLEEEGRAQPDTERIAQMEASMQALALQRRELDPADAAGVARVREFFSAEIRARLAPASTH